MKQTLSFSAFGNATSFLLTISFPLCVTFDLSFPQHAIFEVWRRLLPGFEWIRWRSVLLGLIESYAYGWYIALIWVPLNNVFVSRGRRGEADVP